MNLKHFLQDGMLYLNLAYPIASPACKQCISARKLLMLNEIAKKNRQQKIIAAKYGQVSYNVLTQMLNSP